MFHLRDTWRRHYFDLAFVQSRYWRVSHALSHHLYPNTMRDLEVTEFSPFLLYLPFQERHAIQKHGPPLYAWFLNGLVMPIVGVKQLARFATGSDRPHWEDALVWAELAVLLAINPAHGLGLWLTAQAGCSWFFVSISLVAGTHHHDGIWHEGDARAGRDFGLLQVDATRDRHHTLENAAAVFFFGDHGVHLSRYIACQPRMRMGMGMGG
jgi:hypothetical protein